MKTLAAFIIVALYASISPAEIVSVIGTPVSGPVDFGGSIDWAVWGTVNGEPSLMANAALHISTDTPHTLTYALQAESTAGMYAFNWATYLYEGATYYGGLGNTDFYLAAAYPLGDIEGLSQVMTVYLWEGYSSATVLVQQGAQSVNYELGTTNTAVAIKFTGTAPVHVYASSSANAMGISGATYGYVYAVPEPPLAAAALLAIPFAIITRKRKGVSNAS